VKTLGIYELSVIMAVHNEERFLKQAITSIINQSYRNFEFIIVDDASTDTSPKIIKKFANKDKRIIVIRNSFRIGLTKSLNKALELAKGYLIARQDADDISSLNRFYHQIEAIKKEPNLAVIGSSYYEIDEQNRVIRTILVPKKPNFANRNQLIHGSAVMVKKVVKQVGGYNESFKYAQDYELWLRIIGLKRLKIRNLTEPLYYLRKQRRSVGYRKAFEQYNYAFLAKKNYQIDSKCFPQSLRKLYTSTHTLDKLKLISEALLKNRLYVLLCNNTVGIGLIRVYDSINRLLKLRSRIK
jgi:glycosyltransferase involved in cell wall biosynthesis